MSLRRVTRSFLALLMGMSYASPSLSFGKKSTLRCEQIFTPSLFEVLQKIDSESNNLLFKNQSFESILITRSWNQKRIIRKMLNNLMIEKLSSEEAIDDFVTEFTLLTWGHKTTVDTYLKLNKQQRIKALSDQMIRESLLRNGITTYWKQNFNPQQISKLRKAFDYYSKVKNSRWLEVLSLPTNLITINDKKISNDLLQKIILDGYDAHSAEVEGLLKIQDKIEAYKVFRRLYTTTINIALLSFTTYITYQNLQETQDQEIKKVIKELQENRKIIEDSSHQMIESQIDWVYAEAEQEFVQKWGEKPTEAEAALIKKNIRARLLATGSQ